MEKRRFRKFRVLFVFVHHKDEFWGHKRYGKTPISQVPGPICLRVLFISDRVCATSMHKTWKNADFAISGSYLFRGPVYFGWHVCYKQANVIKKTLISRIQGPICFGVVCVSVRFYAPTAYDR